PFVAVVFALAVAAHAATIPEPEKAKDVEKVDVSKADPAPSDKITAETATVPQAVDRDAKQLYPAGYQPPVFAPAAPIAPLKAAPAAVYSPYPIPAVPAAYPLTYYPSAYPNYPAPYYPTREESSGAEEGSSWSSYFPSGFSSIGNYFSSNYPAYYPAWLGGSESESSSSASNPANPSEAAGSNAASFKSGLVRTNAYPYTYPSGSPVKPLAAAPYDSRLRYQPAQPIQPQFIIAGQPQFYGHYSPFPAQQDPSKLTAANNGAISSYLFLRNQPQLPVYQQNQQKFAAPATFQNGNAKDAHQQFVQYSNELQGESSKQVDNEAAPSEETKVASQDPAQESTHKKPTNKSTRLRNPRKNPTDQQVNNS
ncbi:hypothetical protein WDU94_009574, partial [Cyamophila willieti]